MNPTEDFPSLMSLVDPRAFVATALAAARFFGFMTAFPLFTWVNINGTIRMALAVGLAFGVSVDPDVMGKVMDVSAWFAMMLLAKEVLLGSLLGVLLGLPIWAAQVAGDLADTFRGANAFNVFDPMHAEEMTIGGQVNAVIAMSSIVAIGGVPLVIEVVLLSFGAFPIDRLAFASDQLVAPQFHMLIDKVVSYGLMISAPLLVFMLLDEVLFSMQSKLARQFGLDTLAPALKSVAYLLVVPLYSTFLYQYSESNFGQIFGELFRVFGNP